MNKYIDYQHLEQKFVEEHTPYDSWEEFMSKRNEFERRDVDAS